MALVNDVIREINERIRVHLPENYGFEAITSSTSMKTSSSTHHVNSYVGYIIVHNTCLNYGIKLMDPSFAVPSYESTTSLATFPLLQYSKADKPVIIRVIRAKDNGMTIQGFGSDEDILTMKLSSRDIDFLQLVGNQIEVKRDSVQRMAVRFENAFLAKLVSSEYGILHIAGLSNVIILNICSYLTVSIQAVHDET
jgi:hypothetical protein